jgi:hypothetical protein
MIAIRYDEPIYNQVDFNEEVIVEDRHHKDDIFGKLSKKNMSEMNTS